MADFRPGFRFYPTEEELISFYLLRMLEGTQKELNRVIPVVDIYEKEPWQLPMLAGERCRGDTEQWFFFVPRQEREVRGGRPSRTTAAGYWKATGSPSYVYSSKSKVIGLKKTMVFYMGKAPSGNKTKWKMNEYRAIEEQVLDAQSICVVPKLRHELSLCRVYVASGSDRAFDRRPVEGEARGKMTKEAKGNEMASSSQSATTMMEITTSPESLWEDHVDFTDNWQIGHDLQPLW